MFSRPGIDTIQQHMCFSLSKGNRIPDGIPQKPESYLNPERMSRGITREDFKKLQLAADGEGDESAIEDDIALLEAQAARATAGKDQVKFSVKDSKSGKPLSKDELLKIKI